MKSVDVFGIVRHMQCATKEVTNFSSPCLISKSTEIDYECKDEQLWWIRQLFQVNYAIFNFI